MKTVFLILYFWHADKLMFPSIGTGMNGGPVLKLEPMASLAQCEAVGTAVKSMVDRMAHGPDPSVDDFRAVVYRCIEVPK